MVLNGAADRDPRRFENPGEFQVDRPNAREHLAFGHGPHTCPGGPLARAEARISIERILARHGRHQDLGVGPRARPATAATSTRRPTSCAACNGCTWSSRPSADRSTVTVRRTPPSVAGQVASCRAFPSQRAKDVARELSRDPVGHRGSGPRRHGGGARSTPTSSSPAPGCTARTRRGWTSGRCWAETDSA